MEPTIETGENRVQFEVDEKIFNRQVSMAAAYCFLDRCYVQLARAGRGKLLVQLKGKTKLAKKKLATLAADFENELLHQHMRHQVAEQTTQLREVLVGRALLSAEPEAFEAGTCEEPEADLDYLDDPLGIAVPWEEKYGDESNKDDEEKEDDAS